MHFTTHGGIAMKSIAYSLIVLFLGTNVHAAMVTGSLTGNVSFADAGNIFGLSAGSTIQLDVLYDDGLLTGSGGETVFFNLPGNTMDFTVGTQSFTEAMDTAGGLGPTLFFFDGELSEIKYDTKFGTLGIFFSSIDFFEGNDDAGNAMGGNWDLMSYTVSPVVVPVPAAIWLFGSGLLALSGISRKQNN